MPRPRKWKKVCCLPLKQLYGPIDSTPTDSDVIFMSVEEYETIRLIDYEKMTQEACAKKMNVARATVQKLYTDARGKIADSFVNGSLIKIEGGDYELYDEKERNYGCQRCQRKKRGNLLE